MKRLHYILNAELMPVPCDDILKWAFWMETAERTMFANTTRGGVLVSTVFLGLDHSWEQGAPVLFETMVFGGPLDEDQWRYRTWNEAKDGHAKAWHEALHAELLAKQIGVVS